MVSGFGLVRFKFLKFKIVRFQTGLALTLSNRTIDDSYAQCHVTLHLSRTLHLARIWAKGRTTGDKEKGYFKC